MSADLLRDRALEALKKMRPMAYRFDAPGITKLDNAPHGGAWVTLYSAEQLAVALSSAAPAAAAVDERVEREADHERARALEIIALGESSDPVKDATDVLVETGWWSGCGLATLPGRGAAKADLMKSLQGCVDGWNFSADDEESYGYHRVANAMRLCAADLSRAMAHAALSQGASHDS